MVNCFLARNANVPFIDRIVKCTTILPVWTKVWSFETVFSLWKTRTQRWTSLVNIKGVTTKKHPCIRSSQEALKCQTFYLIHHVVQIVLHVTLFIFVIVHFNVIIGLNLKNEGWPQLQHLTFFPLAWLCF